MIGPHKKDLFTATFQCTSVESHDEEVEEEEDYVYDEPDLEEEIDENMQE